MSTGAKIPNAVGVGVCGAFCCIAITPCLIQHGSSQVRMRITLEGFTPSRSLSYHTLAWCLLVFLVVALTAYNVIFTVFLLIVAFFVIEVLAKF